MSKLGELQSKGQSIWLDYIRRAFMDSGELQNLIEQGVRGLTSNPTIFEKAIAGSSDYDEQLDRLAADGADRDAIYEALVLQDIGRAADLLRPVYDASAGLDGYMSLEVSPALAADTAGTIAEAHRLFEALGRPNVMIKVPATEQGIPAVESLIEEGINVNVTLIFSVSQYEAAAEAYIRGLERLSAAGGDPGKVASVASLFVSRVDTAVDRAIDGLAEPGKEALKGKTAVANAKMAYARFRELFGGQRWQKLAERGAGVQRLLWASTGTKNPLYPDTLYLDSLIGADTVNTVPPATLSAFLDHGTVELTIESGREEAEEQLEKIAALGIDLEKVTAELQEAGVASFAKSFDALLGAIDEKIRFLQTGREMLRASLENYRDAVNAGLEEMAEQRVISRIWKHDHTVWKPDPAEIGNRLGWLHIAEASKENLPRLKAFADQVRSAGYREAVLLGMGGSSLAPEVFSKTFGTAEGFLDLSVIDSTDPGLILSYTESLDLGKTIFIVSTKSGGTVETLSFFKYFYNRVAEAVGAARAGEHFVAITDPGSKLAALAEEYGFRATFINDPNIGGRYSALSYFGLVPAALLGVDLDLLLERALEAACNCESCNCSPGGNNQGALLGTILGRLALRGGKMPARDKLTVFTSQALSSFGDWTEQLIAESTGKEGRGILPVIGEPLGPAEYYGEDRLFVDLAIEDKDEREPGLQKLEAAGHPVVRIRLRDLYDLGWQFFLWEMATAVAGYWLKINPFDQPNVESAKVRAREMVAAYSETGKLPEDRPAERNRAVLEGFLDQARPGDYVAFQAYVQPTNRTTEALQRLRAWIRDRYRLATTVGYGPRFLHSTGQLHKGDGGGGLFVQLTCGDRRDAAIPEIAGKPESTISFATLKMAQALGDKRALEDNERRVLRLHLGEDAVSELERLISG